MMRRLRWVAHATNLLYPLPAEALMVRSPKHRGGITDIEANLKRFLSEAGLSEAPRDLASYVRFVEGTLSRWKEQGAVAVKFWDAYLRTLVFQDVPEERAAALYTKGFEAPLTREEYLAVQDSSPTASSPRRDSESSPSTSIRHMACRRSSAPPRPTSETSIRCSPTSAISG